MPALTPWHARDLRARLNEVVEVYSAALGPPPEGRPARLEHMARHLAEPGLLAFAALDHDDIDEALLGFGYGFPGRDGQWWHDAVHAGLGAAGQHEAAGWTADSFEVAELHVRPDAQDRGLGRALLRALLDAAPHRTALLSTPEGGTPARGLYTSEGFVTLLSGFAFPGSTASYAVLGIDLVSRRSQVAAQAAAGRSARSAR